MKKMWQTEWQGIQFSEFSKMNSTKLAGADFYDAFYRELFARNQNYQDLDQQWRKSKDMIADFIVHRVGPGQRVLSIGCGLGYVEQAIIQRTANNEPIGIELSVHDVAPTALKWLRDHISSDQIFIGLPPDCLPDDIRFDLIYLSAVDYALDDDTLIGALKGLQERLSNSGEIVMISASFEGQNSAFRSLVNSAKDIIKIGLEMFGRYQRGQFWGWARSQKDYQNLMVRAGFRAIEDGFVNEAKRRDYWIAGRL